LLFVDPRGETGALAAPLAAPGLAVPAAGLAIAGGAGYGAGWAFNRGLNRILEWGTGTSLGGLIADMCISSEDEKRCKAIERECKTGCTDVYEDDRNKLPGSGTNYQSRWRRCVRECMEAQGCRFIQAILGHAQLTTTEIYTHVSIAKLKEIHALTHPAERPRVRGYEPDEAAQETLLNSLAADSDA
jgi:hypothetical protein